MMEEGKDPQQHYFTFVQVPSQKENLLAQKYIKNPIPHLENYTINK